MGSPSNNFPLLIGNNIPGFEEGRMRLILHCHLQPWSKCIALNIHPPQFFPLPRSNASTFILCPVFCPACSSCWQFFDADQAFCKRPLRLMWALHCGHNYYFLTLTCNSLKLISLKYICWQLNVVGLKKRRQGTIASSLEGWGGGRGGGEGELAHLTTPADSCQYDAVEHWDLSFWQNHYGGHKFTLFACRVYHSPMTLH